MYIFILPFPDLAIEKPSITKSPLTSKYLKLIVRISKWLCSLVSANIKPKSTYFSYTAVCKPKELKPRLLLLNIVVVVIRTRLSLNSKNCNMFSLIPCQTVTKVSTYSLISAFFSLLA